MRNRRQVHRKCRRAVRWTALMYAVLVTGGLALFGGIVQWISPDLRKPTHVQPDWAETDVQPSEQRWEPVRVSYEPLPPKRVQPSSAVADFAGMFDPVPTTRSSPSVSPRASRAPVAPLQTTAPRRAASPNRVGPAAVLPVSAPARAVPDPAVLRFAALCERLADRVRPGPSQCLAVAKDELREFREGLRVFKPAETQANWGDEDEQLLKCVDDLAEAGAHLQTARRWTEFALRDSWRDVLLHKRRVVVENQRRLRQAQQRLQLAFLVRARALRQLAAWRAGRAELRVREGSSGWRAANLTEKLAFLQRLQAQIGAPGRVRPPRKAKLLDIYDPSQLQTLRESRPYLKDLGQLISGELRRLADRHWQAVQLGLASPHPHKRAAALAAVGHWHGPEGLDLLEHVLASEARPEAEKEAAYLALARFSARGKRLAAYREHALPEFRLLAINTLRRQLDNVPEALELLKPLLRDRDPAVRSEAYATLDGLLTLNKTTIPPRSRIPFVLPGLKSRHPEIRQAAVDWLRRLAQQHSELHDAVEVHVART